MESADEIQADVRALESKGRAAKRLFIHKGPDETVDVVNYVQNPAGAILVLVSFTVPDSMVGYFDSIGVYYSEPLVNACNAVGWRLSIDGRQVPNINHLTTFWRFASYSDVSSPMLVKPIWVQSGETIAVEVEPQVGGHAFANHLTMVGRLTGRLYKPATPELIGGGPE
jgi:hypothetical protein